jgi:hypothetical protein
LLRLGRTVKLAPLSKVAAFAAVSVALAAGCAVEDSTREPAPQEPAAQASQPLLGICQPLTCCFPSGGEWSNNPFEDGLRALGCTKPQAYTESYGKSDWWLYSPCPASLDLVNLVAQYALVSPYYAQLVVNECLLLHGVTDGHPTDVFVEWDPTCGSCRF